MELNYLAILVGSLIAFALGAIWYGPLFGNPWMKIVGLTEKDAEVYMKKNGVKTYGLTFVMAFLTTWILAISIASANSNTLYSGALMGFWLWLGFVLPTQVIHVLFEQRPLKLAIINAGYHLVHIVLAGALLAVWV